MQEGVANEDFHLISEALMKGKDDEVKRQIMNDGILKKLGTVLLNKLGERWRNCVIQRLRQLARLKVQCNVGRIKELINGASFDKVVSAVKILASAETNDEGIRVYKTPSLALSMGNNLKKVAATIAGNAVKEDDQKGLKGEHINITHQNVNIQKCSTI